MIVKLEKSSSEFQVIENVLLKTANNNNVTNVSTVVIDLTKDVGILKFKQAEQEIATDATTPQTLPESQVIPQENKEQVVQAPVNNWVTSANNILSSITEVKKKQEENPTGPEATEMANLSSAPADKTVPIPSTKEDTTSSDVTLPTGNAEESTNLNNTDNKLQTTTG